MIKPKFQGNVNNKRCKPVIQTDDDVDNEKDMCVCVHFGFSV